ncbi:NUDIX domain-containing protein [Rubrobacter indicoceani]|uniref:NUDIX domain-containing protein n=1 Tax=Rubrobacter indicoceani TaxID=2051957 RepID=UPI000E5C555E|nr:NUDIX hydrolase [Rubrobacter indicoceani]
MAAPETPKLTVDIVLEQAGGVVLIQRKNEPFKGRWCLPGGFVDVGESVESAAVREMKEETGLDVRIVRLVGVYSDPERDPRGHSVTVAFLAGKVGGRLRADDDAADAKVLDPESVELGFDHAEVIRDALASGEA